MVCKEIYAGIGWLNAALPYNLEGRFPTTCGYKELISLVAQLSAGQ